MIEKIDYGSKEYLKVLFLRNDILGKPFGKNIFDLDLSEEEKGDIFVYYFGNDIAASCTIILKDNIAKIKWFCIKEKYKEKNIENELLEYCKKISLNKGYKDMVLDSNEY